MNPSIFKTIADMGMGFMALDVPIKDHPMLPKIKEFVSGELKGLDRRDEKRQQVSMLLSFLDGCSYTLQQLSDSPSLLPNDVSGAADSVANWIVPLIKKELI